MVLANLKVSRKLAVGLMCVLVAFAVTGTAFFFTLLSIERANEEVTSASSLSKHLVSATAAIYDEQQAIMDNAGSAAMQAAGQRFSEQLISARNIIAHNPAHAAIAADIDAMDKNVASWRRLAGMGDYTNSSAISAFASARASSEAAKNDANVWLDNAQANLSEALYYSRATQMIGSLLAIAMALVSGWWMSRMIAHPIGQITGAVTGLAAGNNNVQVPELNRTDEIGLMATAVESFKRAAIEKKRLEDETAAAAAAAEEARVKQEAESQFYVDAHNTFMRDFSNALERLSKGDLTFRLNTPFTEDYEKIRHDFNTTASSLQEAVLTIASSTQAIRFATNEISTAADDQSRRTAQQAASLEETAAALDQITATVNKTAEGAGHAREVVASAKSDAEKSDEVVRKAISSMGDIERSSQQISHIIGVIDEIAFQTNLLALNAGVEAARAGEAGRGFAVVASEVRALAQRSAEAAKEIKGLISASTKQVEQGVDLVGQMGQALERIMTEVTEINTIVSEIAAGAKEQAVGLQEINTGVGQMDQVTQQNAAIVEETTAASHGLSREIEKLMDLVGRFETGQDLNMDRPARDSRPAQKTHTALKTVSVRGVPAAVRKLEAIANEQDWEEF
ncbi:methyl-accepting chemotaxis protein [Hyphomicrobium sulfonivorans]|uniref:methyl-accepting chemotaxis protein n=1 Tax=Hyphomicrobium sulfonivorans TaxID=121290 RepID=UPI001570F13B|nr:HAMP domain-containing methyl-accepting chemotaxis protein [Hyphomicrobium sulfonivorans]MBI1648795.1 HAMP domain-containing protein [Hyphomicrobium sulfonivorans]